MLKKVLAALLVSLVIVGLLAGCGKSSESSSPETTEPASTAENVGTDGTVYTMKLSSAVAAGDYRDAIVEKFSETASELSEGRIEIEYYPGGTLGDWRDTIEGLAFGMEEIVIESVGTLDAWCSKANIDAIPYLYSGYDHFREVWDSDIGEEMMEEIGDEGGFVLLGNYYRGARVVTSKVRFTTPEEVDGLKIRVPNIQVYIATWDRMNAVSTPLAATEIFTAIQQNTVEAQENPILTCYSLGMSDVCDYVIKTNHVYSCDTLIFDKEYFNSLPEDIQEILREAAVAAVSAGDQYVLEKEAECEQKFVDDGCEIVEVDAAPFMELFEGFTEEQFPDLASWDAQIREMA